MKTISLLLLISLLSQTAKAQLVVDSVDINKLDIEYIKLAGCDVVSGFSSLSKRASVWIDFGQGGGQRNNNMFLKPDQQQPFNSTVEALNYCCKNGWELVQYTSEPNSTCHNYLLKRRNQPNK